MRFPFDARSRRRVVQAPSSKSGSRFPECREADREESQEHHDAIQVHLPPLHAVARSSGHPLWQDDRLPHLQDALRCSASPQAAHHRARIKEDGRLPMSLRKLLDESVTPDSGLTLDDLDGFRGSSLRRRIVTALAVVLVTMGLIWLSRECAQKPGKPLPEREPDAPAAGWSSATPTPEPAAPGTAAASAAVSRLLAAAQADEKAGRLIGARTNYLAIVARADAEPVRALVEQRLGIINVQLVTTSRDMPEKTEPRFRLASRGTWLARAGCRWLQPAPPRPRACAAFTVPATRHRRAGSPTLVACRWIALQSMSLACW